MVSFWVTVTICPHYVLNTNNGCCINAELLLSESCDCSYQSCHSLNRRRSEECFSHSVGCWVGHWPLDRESPPVCKVYLRCCQIGLVGQTGLRGKLRNVGTWKMKPIPENPQWARSLLNTALHFSVWVSVVYLAVFTALLQPAGCSPQCLVLCFGLVYTTVMQLKGSWWFGNVLW